MISGGPRLSDPDTSYDQSNDMLEGVLAKLAYAHPLQSCGPNASGSCMEAVGYYFDRAPLATVAPGPGRYVFPADDMETEWLNNPRNYRMMVGVDPWREPNHRHARLYPICVRELWGIRATWINSFSMERDALRHLRKGRALQVCLKPPGHYIALVGYDEATGEYIANDSWASRPRVPALPPRGFNFRMTENEVKSIASEAVVYYGPGDNES